MPGMDGIEVQIRVSNVSPQAPDIPIIALTAHVLKGDREKLIRADLSDYIRKPVDPELLLKKVEMWLFERGLTVEEHYSVTMDEREMDISPIDNRVHLNEMALYNRLMQDEDLMRMILGEFLKDLPRQIAQLKGEVAVDDFSGILRQAHKMKGAAGNVGAEILQGLLVELEEAGKLQDVAVMNRLLLAVDFEYVAIREAVEVIVHP